MFHRAPRVATGVALALILAGCSSSATPTPAPTVAPATVAPATVAPATAAAPTPAAIGSIVMIPKQVNNPYFDVAFKGAQNAATALGGTLTQVGPSAADATQQIPFIQTATTQKASAIIVSADDATAIAPALQAAMAAGIKVVGYDSSPAVGAYNVFVNQADTAGIGKGLADMACDEAPSCTGEIAVLSAAQTATNQNAWIAAMQTTLKDAKYAGLKWDGVVYGNDDPAISTTQAQALLSAHPNLKVIVSPTTVGIVAAAQVVKAKNLTGKVFVTGLGTPKGMVDFVKAGQSPVFALWNVTDLGYLAYAVAVDLINGTIKGTVGEKFTVKFASGSVDYTIVAGTKPDGTPDAAASVVVLGPPFVFNKDNIDSFVTSFGF
jgi:rhamnose transport system substrate-binding protein